MENLRNRFHFPLQKYQIYLRVPNKWHKNRIILSFLELNRKKITTFVPKIKTYGNISI